MRCSIICAGAGRRWRPSPTGAGGGAARAGEAACARPVRAHVRVSVRPRADRRRRVGEGRGAAGRGAVADRARSAQLEAVSGLDAEAIETRAAGGLCRPKASSRGCSTHRCGWPMTGSTVSPGLYESLELLGRSESLGAASTPRLARSRRRIPAAGAEPLKAVLRSPPAMFHTISRLQGVAAAPESRRADAGIRALGHGRDLRWGGGVVARHERGAARRRIDQADGVPQGVAAGRLQGRRVGRTVCGTTATQRSPGRVPDGCARGSTRPGPPGSRSAARRATAPGYTGGLRVGRLQGAGGEAQQAQEALIRARPTRIEGGWPHGWVDTFPDRRAEREALNMIVPPWWSSFWGISPRPPQ